MMKNNYAPVLISVYNRVNHFKQCLDSLSKCKGADKTVVFISSDAPKSDKDEKNVSEVRKTILNYKGFKKIVPVFSETNTNGQIIREAINQLFNKYDRCIRSEDDNIFSPDFLTFVNRGLDVYEDREDIYSISGYQYPISMPQNYNKDVYLWQGFSAWGVGIWRDKFEKVERDPAKAMAKIRAFLKDYKAVYKHHMVANHYVPNKIAMLRRNRIAGDGLISLYLFENNMFSVFPTISRVRNMGHDGSGVHCGFMKANTYRHQPIYEGNGGYELPFDIATNEEINKALYKHFKRLIRSNVKTLYHLFLVNTGLLYPHKPV